MITRDVISVKREIVHGLTTGASAAGWPPCTIQDSASATQAQAEQGAPARRWPVRCKRGLDGAGQVHSASLAPQAGATRARDERLDPMPRAESLPSRCSWIAQRPGAPRYTRNDRDLYPSAATFSLIAVFRSPKRTTISHFRMAGKLKPPSAPVVTTVAGKSG